VLLLFSHTDAGYAIQPLHDQPARAGCLLKGRVFDVPVLVDAPWRFAKGASVADRWRATSRDSRRRADSQQRVPGGASPGP
jgi:hypothetical protein